MMHTPITKSVKMTILHAWNISVKMIIELTKFCDQNCGYQYIKQLPVLKWRRMYTEFKIHNFSKTIRRTFLSPVIFTRVQFYACYVIETCLYWEHHAVMEVSLMSVNFSLKWLPSQEIKLYLFKLIEFMCATFEVQMTNGLIDEMKWGKLNTLSLSQFRVWPLRSNRQLRFDKKDVYGN